jgi:hypothetical protein
MAETPCLDLEAAESAAALFNNRRFYGTADWRIDVICVLGEQAALVVSDLRKCVLIAAQWNEIHEQMLRNG